MSGVKANKSLAKGWWRDPVVADYVWEQIVRAIHDGLDDHAVARLVGCTSQTVMRYRHQERIPNYRGRSGGGDPNFLQKTHRIDRQSELY